MVFGFDLSFENGCPMFGKQCLDSLEDLSENFIFVDDPSLYILYKVAKRILTYALVWADASLKNATIPRVVVRDGLVDRFQLHDRSGESSLPSHRKIGDPNTPNPIPQRGLEFRLLATHSRSWLSGRSLER